MKEISIENLVYHLKQASERGLPKPIFFLGAGASFSGQIPLASGIEKIIKDQYEDNPNILTLADTDKTYSRLMACLHPVQRNELLSSLIEKAKINVTHIYLAQLIEKNLIDYVLTSNFDNLMLRALALFDIFPPVYDLTSISDFTTTTIKQKSVVYLHGQHNGSWLLNTDEEMNKVKTTIQRIFDTIKNQRPWIFLGYSGNDPIFEHIKNLGRFDNGLYWVGHDDYLPSEEVQSFLKKPNTNAHFITGYDADAFMLKLNHELGLAQPDILDKPFSSLRTMLSNIVDIDDEDHFRGAKVRLEIAKKNIDHSIQLFENMSSININKREQNIDKLKKDIIDLIISEKYDENAINVIDSQAKKFNDQGINNLLAELFFYVGNKYTSLIDKNDVDNRERLLNITIKNYSKSLAYIPYSSQSLYNYAVSLSELASLKTGVEAEALYKQAIEKYRKAIEINHDKSEALNNLGITLINLAALKTGTEAETLYHQGFEQYYLAVQAGADKKNVFNNWGIGLLELAALKTGTEAGTICEHAIEKFSEAIELDPTDSDVFKNYALSSLTLAEFKTGAEAETLYKQAIEKFRQILEINPEKHINIYNLAFSLLQLANVTTGEIADKLYKESFEKFQQAVDVNVDSFDVFTEWAIGLSKQATTKSGVEAEALYKQAIEKYNKAIELKPDNNIILYNWGLCLSMLAKFKFGIEAEAHYKQAIEKYVQANEICPRDYNLLNNWGSTLIDLAVLKTGTEVETICKQAIKKFSKANEINPKQCQTLQNWGNAIILLAMLKTGTEAETLYEQAIEKFNKAMEADPKQNSILETWGFALQMLANSRTGAEAKELYEESCVKLEKAYEHNNKCYNLACSYAQLERTEQAFKYLGTSLVNKERTVEEALADAEWTKYLDNKNFIKIIKRHTE